MAQILVRNSLNPNLVIKIGISFTQVADYYQSGSNSMWIIELGTSAKQEDGSSIKPLFINNIKLSDKIEVLLEKAITYICSQVGWGTLLKYNFKPYVDSVSPVTYLVTSDNVVDVNIKENIPSAGIDKDSIKCFVNGLDVSDELFIYGNLFNYRVIWYPRIKVNSTY